MRRERSNALKIYSTFSIGNLVLILCDEKNVQMEILNGDMFSKNFFVRTILKVFFFLYLLK